MADDIPYDKSLELVPRRVDEPLMAAIDRHDPVEIGRAHV